MTDDQNESPLPSPPESPLVSPFSFPIPVHLITVGADERELKRTAVMAEMLKPYSSQTFSSLEELGDIHSDKIPKDGPVLIRLAGAANTKVLTWLGPGGRVATDAAILGYADAIILEAGPGREGLARQPARAISVLPTAFVSAIASRKISFDTTGAGIIIGACDHARAMAASLSRLGFKRLMLVDSDDSKADQMANLLRKRLFGIEIQVVRRSSLTQAPSEASMAINLVEISQAALLEDVSYLNFLKKNGVWMDWTDAAVALGYSDEITNAGAQMFSSDVVRAWREACLLGAISFDSSLTGQKPQLKADILAPALCEAWSQTSS